MITPVNLLGHIGLLASKSQMTLSNNSKPLGLLIALSLFFFCKTKTQLKKCYRVRV